MDIETIINTLPHIILHFQSLDSSNEIWNKFYCKALFEIQKILNNNKDTLKYDALPDDYLDDWMKEHGY